MGKYKTSTGVSNDLLIPKDKHPRTPRDATSRWIQDQFNNPNQDSLAETVNNAIATSLPKTIQRSRKWVKNHYNEVYLPSQSRSISQTKERQLFQSYLNNRFSSLVQVNYAIEDTEIRTVVRHIMQQECSYNAQENTFLYQGELTYLEDVRVRIKTPNTDPAYPYSFTSGETPFRALNLNAPHSVIQVAPSLPEGFFVVGCFRAVYKRIETIKRITGLPDEVVGTREEKENMDRIYLDSYSYPPTVTEHQISANIFERITETIYKRTVERFHSFGKFSYDIGKTEDDAIPDIPPDIGTYYSLGFLVNGKQDYLLLSKKELGALGKVLDSGKTYQEFIPKLYFRFDKEYLAKGHPLYKPSIRYCAKLGLPYHTLLRKVKKGIKDEQLDKIVSVYLNFGIKAKGKAYDELLYVWNFIKDWYFESCANNEVSPSLVQDNEVKSSELIFDNKVQKQRLKAGVIKVTIESSSRYQKGTIYGGANNKPWDGTDLTGKGRWLVSAYQIEDNKLIIFSVDNPIMLSHVYKGHMAEVNLESENATLIFPVSYDYYRNIKKFRTKEATFYDSLYLEATTFVQVKKKWYERGWFKIISKIVIAVISIFTYGYGTTLYGLLYTLAYNLAIQVAVQLGLKALYKILPATWLKFFGFALAALAIYAGVTNYFDLSRAFAILQMKATTLLDLSSQFMGASAMKTQASIIEKSKEMQQRLKRLEEYKRELLSSGSSVDTRKRNINYLESPTEMIQRTLSVNVGLLPIGFISTSVAYALQLPTLTETINRRNLNGSSRLEYTELDGGQIPSDNQYWWDDT